MHVASDESSMVDFVTLKIGSRFHTFVRRWRYGLLALFAAQKPLDLSCVCPASRAWGDAPHRGSVAVWRQGRALVVTFRCDNLCLARSRRDKGPLAHLVVGCFSLGVKSVQKRALLND